ncbi:ABC transporter permease [Desulfurococcaceae archaeon MEX13E-LK6-19]|nr:ABC transporter permease [Desulfurococcaceae archaeon MEX13E-LK6-19]
MPGVGRILVRRAIALGLALIIVVFLTGVIMEATGYSERVWKAIIQAQVRAYVQQLLQKRVPTSEVQKAAKELEENLTRIYGLDQPWYVRVFPLVQRTLVFDLGIIMSPEVANVAGIPYPAPVKEAIFVTLPRTIVMITVAEIICIVIALPFAPRIAYRHGTKLDKAVVTYAALFNAIPVWWLGMLFLFLFGYELGVYDTAAGRKIIPVLNNFWEDPISNFIALIKYSYLPIVVIVISFLGGWFYSIRAITLRIVREDYVTVAKAKGLPEKIIARRYILRVLAPPVTTYVILALAGSIGGFIITESVFDWPGMGSLYFAAITGGDVATILGLTYVLTMVYIIARFILEVLYILLDPRIRMR